MQSKKLTKIINSKKNYAIDVSNLIKKYDDFTAVKGISFKVKNGEIFGFLGPNGAGKTTTVHMLTTIIPPTSGTAFVSNYNIYNQKEEVRSRIGIVFQDPSLDDKLTGRENLEFHAMIYGMGKAERGRAIEEMLKMVELSDKADMLIEDYSGGMKRRLEIARGLLNKPTVLFLDEPTIGLDAQTRRHILDYILNLNKKYNLTVFITTHYIEEANYLCDRVAIIDHGNIVACDTPTKLKDGLKGDSITVTLMNKDMAKKLDSVINKLKGINTVKQNGEILYVYVDDATSSLINLMKTAYKSRIEILNIEIHKPSLEDVFIYYTGKGIRESEAEQNDRARTMIRNRMRR
jgi:ABC-2 type transport system ATP-binding protein